MTQQDSSLEKTPWRGCRGHLKSPRGARRELQPLAAVFPVLDVGPLWSPDSASVCFPMTFKWKEIKFCLSLLSGSCIYFSERQRAPEWGPGERKRENLPQTPR